MRRLFQIIPVIIIAVSVAALSVFSVSAYDTTNVSTVEITEINANASGQIVEIQYSTSNQMYYGWTTPQYSAYQINFQVKFPENFSNFRLEIPIDFSVLKNIYIESCQLFVGAELLQIQATIEGNTLIIAGNNEVNTDYFICYLSFSATSDNPGNIYFGRFATANYDVSYEEEFNELNSEVDGMTSQLENLESEALGGKTDEEIQSEAASAADFDYDSLNSQATQGVTGFINDCLDTFGAGYSSLLLFSCSIGLCIFVIGRRGGS